MKVTILGCGTASLDLKKHESGYLLGHDGKYYLFDSGAGTAYRLLEVGVKVTDIEVIFYTHFHNDHINDLPAILWSSNFHDNSRSRELNLYGPHGFKDYCNILLEKITVSSKSFKFPIDVQEVTNKEFSVGGLNIKTQELKHFGNIAYRVEADGKVLVYSGDTEYCKEIEEIAREADVLILECGVAKAGEPHLVPEECGIVAKNANVKKLILTHMYPELDNVDVISIVKKNFDGEIELAEDFKVIDI